MKFGKGYENYTKEEQTRIALGRQVASEGMVLLENNGALPLKPGAKVALFGVGQIGFLHGGSGSGSTFADYVVKLPEAMENAGAAVDQPLLSLYADYCAAEQKKVEKEPPHMRRGTIPELVLPEAAVKAAADRNDAAIVSFARLAGEGRDRKLEQGDYYLSEEEHALLRAVRAHFKTVIVLLNICGTIDMNWVDTYRPDGVLMVWIPGQEGADAAADILMGHVNPSGLRRTGRTSPPRRTSAPGRTALRATPVTKIKSPTGAAWATMRWYPSAKRWCGLSATGATPSIRRGCTSDTAISQASAWIQPIPSATA